MNSKITIIAIVVLLAGLGWFAYSTIDKDASAPEEFVVVEEPVEEEVSEAAEEQQEEVVEVQEEELQQEIVLPENPTTEQRFEYTLNVMLRDISAASIEYKDARKAMREMAAPENFADKEKLSESYEVFQDLTKSLNQKSAEILGIFERADAVIKELAADKSEEGQKAILDKWNGVKNDKAGAYLAFFEREAEAIKSYDRLMRFYYTKLDFYTVDEQTGEIQFVNESDAKLAHTLRLQVNRMDRTQSSGL